MSIKERAGEHVLICLMGNKIDLANEGNKHEMVQEEDVRGFAEAHKIKHFLSSAKMNINIYEAFYYLAKEIGIKNIKNSRVKIKGINLDKQNSKQRKSCICN